MAVCVGNSKPFTAAQTAACSPSPLIHSALFALSFLLLSFYTLALSLSPCSYARLLSATLWPLYPQSVCPPPPFWVILFGVFKTFFYFYFFSPFNSHRNTTINGKQLGAAVAPQQNLMAFSVKDGVEKKEFHPALLLNVSSKS